MIQGKYIEVNTNKQITVVSASNGIVVLSNGERVDENFFLNSGNYNSINEGYDYPLNRQTQNNRHNVSTQLNPDSFFNAGSFISNNLASQISNIDTSNVSDNVSYRPSVEIINDGYGDVPTNNQDYMYDEEMEKEELARKYKNLKPFNKKITNR